MFKKSKLISSLIPLAVLSIFASIIGVKAESTNNVYEVTGAYKVEIPAEISIDPDTKKGNIDIAMSLAAYSKLDISIGSKNSYELKCENANKGIHYDLYSDSIPIGNDYEISHETTVPDEGEEVEKSNHEIQIVLGTVPEPYISRTYQDTLTFSMDYQKLRYKLTYDSNDGDVTSNCQWLENNTAYGTLPVLTREGYNFLGWYTDANGGTEVDANTTMQGADTTIYAHWEPIQYTIQYENNSATHTKASGTMVPSSVTYGSEVKLSKNTFTNNDDGAHFVGWTTNADGTGIKYKDQADGSNLTTEDDATITLYAQWEYDNKVIVRFEDVNGNFREEDTREVVSGIYPSGQVISWQVSDLDEYKTDSEQWKKQWQTPAVKDVNYTTTNASKTITIDIYRQVYYLDLNAQWYQMIDGKEQQVKGGEGNLKWNGTETVAAKAEVIVNGKSMGSDLTDYFKQHRYGSTFEFIITMESGYELLRIADMSAQPLSKVTYDENKKKVTGIVTGEREANSSNSDTGKYFVTSVALCIMQKSTENTTPDTEGKSLDEEAENSDSQNTEFVSNEENTSVDIDTTDSTIPCDTDLEWENSNTEDALTQDENSDNQILSETGQTAENLDIQEIESDQMQAESEPENEEDESFSE